MGFEVSLLGVRGSYSSSKSRPSLYGSHTTCALVQAGSQMIMLDAGSGATNVDTDRVRGWSGEDFSLLLTHYHHDHVIGFPFMARPAAGTLQVFGPRLDEVGPEEALRRMGRGDNKQIVDRMTLLEAGLWSARPAAAYALEDRLSEKQGAVFVLDAPDAEAARSAYEAQEPAAKRRRSELHAGFEERQGVML